MNKNKFYIFVADWCPYCRQVKPVIFDLVEKYYDNGNIVLIEDTSEEYKEFGTKLNATAFPAFIIANENLEEVARFEGNRTFEDILNFYASNTDTPIANGESVTSS